MQNCKICEYAIFDELWGEYKCEVRQCVTYNADYERMLVDDCKDYKNGVPKKSKDIQEES